MTKYINPRTPVGCDSVFAVRIITSGYFNPRTPVGCDVSIQAQPPVEYQFQSTHPSGVRRVAGLHADRQVGISIHAPQWGATAGLKFARRLDVISIHAPQWGATPNAKPSFSRSAFQSTHPSGVRLDGSKPSAAHFIFQSTHPSGVRLPDRSHLQMFHVISIHAPQWGATKPHGAPSRLSTHFNPRTPVGCDHMFLIGGNTRTDFNPRTPVGCDQPHQRQLVGSLISIHAPQWGATDAGAYIYVDGSISIHAPQWGATGPTSPVF